jgi:hypothetical protein
MSAFLYNGMLEALSKTASQTPHRQCMWFAYFTCVCGMCHYDLCRTAQTENANSGLREFLPGRPYVRCWHLFDSRLHTAVLVLLHSCNIGIWECTQSTNNARGSRGPGGRFFLLHLELAFALSVSTVWEYPIATTAPVSSIGYCD